jgi:APA family basic amino acid/polyamine antiporter
VDLTLERLRTAGPLWVGSGSWGTADVPQPPSGAFGVVHGAFLVFFTYLGFGSIVTLTEEAEDATVTIPRATVASIAITTVLYVFVGLSAVAPVAWQTLGASSSPLAVVARVGWGPVGETVLAVIALFSTTNTVLILQTSTSRLLYGVSKSEYHVFPAVLSRVHPGLGTPHYAAGVVAAWTVPFVLLGDIGLVADLANLVLLVVFVLVNAALLRLRYGRPDAERGFRAPLNVGRLSLTAGSGLLSSLGLVAFYVATW